MACGTPVVAFSDTGLSDIVDHKVNGYLAKTYFEEDLARGISWTISDKKKDINIFLIMQEKKLLVNLINYL